jgi:hypothetical protein
VLVVVSVVRWVGCLRFVVGIVRSVSGVERVAVLPVQVCEVSGGGSDAFSSFFVLLCLSSLRLFCESSAELGAVVECGGYGSCDHSES